MIADVLSMARKAEREMTPTKERNWEPETWEQKE